MKLNNQTQGRFNKYGFNIVRTLNTGLLHVLYIFFYFDKFSE